MNATVRELRPRAVSPIGDTPPNEAQARELVPVLRDEGPEAVAVTSRPSGRGRTL